MENLNNPQYTIVDNSSQRYEIEIHEISGITIRGKKIGEIDELITINARGWGTKRKFNIVFKKSHAQHFVCDLMTIERVVGESAKFKSTPQLGFKRTYKLNPPKRIWAYLQYIPANGAYKTKDGEVMPYKLTDIYRPIMCESTEDLLHPDKPCVEWDAEYAFEILYGNKCDYNNKEQVDELQRIKLVLAPKELTHEKAKLFMRGLEAYKEWAKENILIK